MTTAAHALEIAGLTKRFNAVAAVDRLDLVIPRGQFHALLGPNRAGKTTTLRIVAGLLKADQGRVAVLGHDVATGGAAIFVFCAAGTTLSAGSIQILLPRPGRRRDLRRRSQGNLLASVLELVTATAWPALTWCLRSAPLFAPLPALAAIAAPLLAAWLGRERRREASAA
jgi:ABC-type cobalamin/Fe3+-siderophores transport system ATPase subunit